MPTPEQLVAALPTGKAHAIHAKQLETALGIEPGGVNSDKTRRFVRRATIEHNLPIGGGLENGLFILDSDEEHAEVVRRYKARRALLSRRQTWSQKAFVSPRAFKS